MRAGIEATGVSYAATTAEKTLPYLDAHARALREARTETCLDTTVRETWEEETQARSLWCLDERRLALTSLAEELSEATPTAVQKAVRAAAGLPRIEPCRDADLLARLPPPPDDPDAVAEVRKALSRAATLEATGDYDEGLAAARQALERAEALAWPPLVAAARNRVGSLLDRKADYEAAEESLEDAYFEAMEAGSLETAIGATTRLVGVVGYHRQRHEDGLRWGRHAKVVLRALGEPVEGLRRTRLLNNLAAVYWSTGDYDRARELHERALDIRRKTLGEEHPDVANSLNNLALVYLATGDYDRAREFHERALDIRRKTLGEQHPGVALLLNNLGNIYRATGDYDRAREFHERALDIRRKTLGEEHPDVAQSLNNLATVYQNIGDYERARELYQRAVDILQKTLGEQHPGVTYPLTGLAGVALAEHRPAEALRYAERAVAIREDGKAAPELIAQSRFALARALWDAPAGEGRDRARAVAEARKAADLYRGVKGKEKALAEVKAWLATHRLPGVGEAFP